MTKKIIKLDVGIGLADSEFRAYEYKVNDDKIKLRMELWNARECVFEFFDHILFVDRVGDFITNLCIETDETDLYKQAIKRMGNPNDSIDKYKLFQFLDLDDEPCIEILCTHFNCKISG